MENQYSEGALNEMLKPLQDEIAELKAIVKAVAHIGIDFGYGKFELDGSHIKKARELLEGEE